MLVNITIGGVFDWYECNQPDKVLYRHSAPVIMDNPDYGSEENITCLERELRPV